MIDIRITEKINALKEKFFDAEDDVQSQIKMWENEITKLSLASDFVQQPITQNIVTLLRDRLKSILIERATKGHTDILDAREKEIRYILSLFCPKYEQELGSLEQIIDNELL